MALLLVSGAVTPGASVSNCRKLRVGRGRDSRVRETMVEASAELSLGTGGGASITGISALLCAPVKLPLIMLVSARPTSQSGKAAGLTPTSCRLTTHAPGRTE